MSEIEPGDGWRLIDKHTDKPREGDQYLYWNKWRDRPKPLDPWDFTHTYRRRIPAKPEAMEIDDELTIKTGDITNQPCLLHREEDKPYWICFDPHECRKLADWLARYADWREAQESVAKTPPN
jgi:hypothetical protein